MAKLFPIVSCALLFFAAYGCSSSKSGTTTAESEPPPTASPKSPCAFDRTLTSGATTVRVLVPASQSCSVGTISFEANVSGNDKTFSHDRDGTVADAWLLDLDGNGALDLVVATRSAGSGSYGNLVVYEASAAGFEERTYSVLSEEQMKKYRGKDNFTVVDGVLYRSVPLYEEGDPLANPTGGMVKYRYSFETMGWTEAP
jgi:hypothetical protein